MMTAPVPRLNCSHLVTVHRVWTRHGSNTNSNLRTLEGMGGSAALWHISFLIISPSSPRTTTRLWGIIVSTFTRASVYFVTKLKLHYYIRRSNKLDIISQNKEKLLWHRNWIPKWALSKPYWRILLLHGEKTDVSSLKKAFRFTEHIFFLPGRY